MVRSFDPSFLALLTTLGVSATLTVIAFDNSSLRWLEINT
jgi:hypothetical protein